ncbi:permease [Staphylococcus epidermidis]|uniref:Membrane protein, putative n=1 Tax=Staphylococcus epidermidis (strain ATCC 35984 / DSM 28319 / BCRC 17069 / CCUG 31568 / BM 3577 / RP62A) TaxID=176279 RepID=Q5HKC3_STAEQ|nr:permease [Staphylococcus epidermidis]AAW53273.1 membrane protein, putative [Staphylococcus epidermidis RP62A]EJE46286.1 putative permease [Staphylococcus epidermidis NIH051475]MCG1533006.1 permease [Staphylococcus epidermidis]MCG2031142.1 permease [Staphylococcus epidermidis]MCG7807669.1 permease [Staphylococcus epidermidis]
MLDSIMEFIKTFVMLFFELLTLFIIVSFIVSLIQQVVSEEKIKRFLSKPNQAISYVLGMVFGAMTPFCSCSTIPILAGLLNSKVPFGPAVSFLIASPLMNPLMIFMLWALLGWKVAIVYFIVLTIFSILTGFVFSKMNLAETYKGVNVKGDGFFANKTESRFKQALNDAWAFLYPMLPYLFIGVFIGAFIYGFVPETFITKYASGGGIISVFIASIIGIPMYIRPETMLPIAEALASKGMSLGTVVALIIGGAGASIPEVVLLSKLFKKKFVISFVIAILVVAISTGLMVNIVI